MLCWAPGLGENVSGGSGTGNAGGEMRCVVWEGGCGLVEGGEWGLDCGMKGRRPCGALELCWEGDQTERHN